ncbi:hypothetical protein PAMP_003134 [Pampus punctatissimus]
MGKGRPWCPVYSEARGPSLQKVNHVAQASFQVDAFGQTFVLDVELNHPSFPSLMGADL